MSGKVYPPKFYKYLTEKKLNEREDWDIQPEEIYNMHAYEEYLEYINSLFAILKDLKAKGKEDSEEFKKTYAELSEFADIPDEFKVA